MSNFSKYKERGPYHWEHLSKMPWRHHCITAVRYSLVLDSAEIKEGENALDLGCGDGALTYLLYKKDAICTGVEPDVSGMALAESMFRLRGGKAKFLSRIEDVTSESQDVIICSEVIEHVLDVDSLLTEAKRTLKPGGRMILSTPVRLTEYPFDKEHIKEYFPSEFENVISKHFEVTRHRLELPAFAVLLYYWAPWFFLRLPIIKYFMNILSAWFGVHVMKGVNSLNRFHNLQIITSRKSFPNPGTKDSLI
jgi:SAM-dependent methyltransferase